MGKPQDIFRYQHHQFPFYLFSSITLRFALNAYPGVFISGACWAISGIRTAIASERTIPNPQGTVTYLATERINQLTCF